MTTERILIVEDEIAVARGQEYALQVERFEVFCAADGRSASGLASTRKIVTVELSKQDWIHYLDKIHEPTSLTFSQ